MEEAHIAEFNAAHLVREVKMRKAVVRVVDERVLLTCTLKDYV